MSTLNKTLAKQKVLLFFLFCFLSPLLFRANNETIKDSLLIIMQSGKDKRYYKACAGKDVKLLCSHEKNEIKVLGLGSGIDHPFFAGRNDFMCSEKTNILLMGLNNLLTCKSGFIKLGAIPLAGN